MIQQIICTLKADNLLDFTDAISLVITNLAVVFKSVNILFKLKAITNSVETLNRLLIFSAPDNANDDRVLLRSQVNFGFKVLKVLWLTAEISCLSALIAPIIFHKLAYKVWFPFDTDGSEVGFWAASIFMMLNAPILSTLDVALDIIPVIFLTFAIGLTNELADRLSNISTAKGSQEMQLKKCVKIHVKIIKYVSEIENNFSSVILIQGVLSSAILCTTAFTMSIVRFSTFISRNIIEANEHIFTLG